MWTSCYRLECITTSPPLPPPPQYNDTQINIMMTSQHSTGFFVGVPSYMFYFFFCTIKALKLPSLSTQIYQMIYGFFFLETSSSELSKLLSHPELVVQACCTAITLGLFFTSFSVKKHLTLISFPMSYGFLSLELICRFGGVHPPVAA